VAGDSTEETSEFFDMPKSAIDAGVVNLILPISEIAAALDYLTRAEAT